MARQEPAAKNRFIFANKQLNKLPNSLKSLFTKQRPFSKPMAVYGLHDIFTRRGSLQDETVYDLISRRFGEDFAKYAIDPMCRGIFAGDCRKLSAVSAFPVLHEAEKTGGSIIRGMIKKPKSSPANQRQRPCALHEKVTSQRWATYSFKNGLQFLTDSLAENLSSDSNVELVKNAPCSDLTFKNGKARVLVSGEELIADHVISSIYAQDLAKILQPELTDMTADLNSIPAVDVAIVCLEFDGSVQPPTPGKFRCCGQWFL